VTKKTPHLKLKELNFRQKKDSSSDPEFHSSWKAKRASKVSKSL